MLKTREEIIKLRETFKQENKKVVFTNGCFDIIHAGHIDYLTKAKSMGDILIVGLNSDESVKKVKGLKRPILDQEERAYILVNLKAVDYVTLFDDDTPEVLINELIPDVLVKGADWPIEKIVGREVVERHGGAVKNIEFVTEQSTSGIIQIIVERFCE